LKSAVNVMLSHTPNDFVQRKAFHGIDCKIVDFLCPIIDLI